MIPKNRKLLVEFVKYCEKHKTERFWQALRNWAGVPYIFVGDKLGSEVNGGRDTFYFEGKTK